MKTYKTIIGSLAMFLTCSALAMSLEGRELYDHGVSLYKEKKNVEAEEALESFVRDNPKSVKYDDALWYLGRLYNRLDRPDDAERMFRTILDLGDGNRLTEAGYDLGKIYFSAKRYTDVIDLLTPVPENESLDRYQVRGTKLVAMSFYNLGVQAKREYRDEDAVRLYAEAARHYEIVISYEDDPVELTNLHYATGKAYDRILYLSSSHEQFKTYKTRAEEHLETALSYAAEEDRQAITTLLESVREEGTVSYKVSGNALGGVDQITGSFGLRAFVDSYLRIPLNWRNELEFGATYSHNDFSFKASNFDDTKIGDLRLVQSVDKVGADVSWTSGTRRGFENTLSAEGDLRFAEDIGDDYWSVQVANESAYRINHDWKVGLDESFAYKIYPDYLVAGNKLDYYLLAGSPWVKWYVLPWLDIGLGYEFSFKQYLASTYDTASGAPSTLDKQYFVNTGMVEFDAKLGSIVRPKVTYEITYQETNNYDYWVSGNPADIFIEDYYDYLRQTLDIETEFRWTDTFRTKIGAKGGLQNFTNYIARDETKTFTGEKRRDVDLNLDLEVRYTFLTLNDSSFGLLVRGWWDISRSNMLYETSFDTNNESYGITAGIEIDLR